MDRIKLISGYDAKIARETLDKILRNKRNEFRELTYVLSSKRLTRLGGNNIEVLP